MGARIVLANKEPIALALRRFKKLLERSNRWREIRERQTFYSRTAIRRAKQFKKRFKARMATYLAQAAGVQPIGTTVSEALSRFWQRTGKP
jgi:ribosomal protein S21